MENNAQEIFLTSKTRTTFRACDTKGAHEIHEFPTHLDYKNETVMDIKVVNIINTRNISPLETTATNLINK